MFGNSSAGKVLGGRRIVILSGQSLILAATLAICQPTFKSQGLGGEANSEMTDSEPPMKTVLASDIGRRVQIIGLLGHPLGKLITIRGSWTFPREFLKDMEPKFTITSVNGNKLTKPVDFRHGDFHCLAEEIPEREGEGEVWEVRGCESGRFWGAPSEVEDDVSVGGKPLPPQQQIRLFGFYTYFMYSSYKPVNAALSK